MIKNRKDYRYYLECDAKSRNIQYKSLKRRIYHALFDEVWQFHLLLRKYEFYRNTKKNPLSYVWYQVIRYRYRRKSTRLSFSIPPNVLGPGCYLPHYGTIVFNETCRVGKNTLIHADVVVGANNGSYYAPIIGDNVFIGPGVKIFGEISIADNVYISANSVVNKPLSEANAVYGGAPAKFLKKEDVVWWKKNRLALNE